MANRIRRHNVLLIFLTFLITKANLLAAGDEHWEALLGNPGLIGSARVWQHQGDLYAFGAFLTESRITANIAKWNAGVWVPLGDGMESGVATAASDGRNLYVGGSFSTAGGIPARNVARWDGTNWFPLGEGVNGWVRCIAVGGSNVFVGGGFTEAGGILVDHVARWDGTRWSNLGDGIYEAYDPRGGISRDDVDCMVMDGTDLIVAGSFRRAGNVDATNIARWNGFEWQALGKGLRNRDGPFAENGWVGGLAAIDGVIYAGGYFALAGNVEVSNIAQWSADTGWQPLGGGVSGVVWALAANGKVLYAGGPSRLIAGNHPNNVVRWDGNAWATLGTGVLGTADSLAAAGDELFVGGNFEQAGGKPSTNVAIWHVPHSLNIKSQSGQVRLSWPATGSNFVLEAKSALNDTNWSALVRTPAIDSDERVITDPVDRAHRFYRLRRK